MNKIGVFYGSTTGTTEEIARKIGEKLGLTKADIHDAAKIKEELVKEYDVLLLGTSTWGDGELQDDWYDGVKILKKADLSNKFVALFGCGDSESYSDTFCGGMGALYEELKETGCTFCGATDIEGYSFDSSESVVDGKFVGLALDDVNEDDKTDERIDHWIETLKKECSK
ncbi:MAG: flavodoxin [Bacteroidetes bacterium]|nr:flavodoxin [Bacteroidota bacterium]